VSVSSSHLEGITFVFDRASNDCDLHACFHFFSPFGWLDILDVCIHSLGEGNIHYPTSGAQSSLQEQTEAQASRTVSGNGNGNDSGSSSTGTHTTLQITGKGPVCALTVTMASTGICPLSVIKN
jgi:hypothetical protein